MHMIECLCDGWGCCGDDWQVCQTCAALQPWMEALRHPRSSWSHSPNMFLFFFSPKQTHVIKKLKSIFIIEFPKHGRATIGHSPRPALPLPIPMTSAPRTMRHPAALRALAPRHGHIRAASLFHLVIFKDDIHSLSAFRYCLHRDFYPPLSCRCLAPVASLWWKGRHSIGKQSLKCGGYYSPVCTGGKPAQLSWLIKS